MAKQYVMINDIIEEHNARMYNLRKYYPFFVLSETAFTQYRDGRYNSLDMGYITMAVLRFFIEENNFNERDITYPQCEAFIKELLIRDFDIEIEDEDMADLILYIFDKIRNDGKAFEFIFYDPGKKRKKTGRHAARIRWSCCRRRRRAPPSESARGRAPRRGAPR